MTDPVLEDAFAHHAWATLEVMNACDALQPDQLGTAVPGTYGSIIDTMRHLVAADSGYLSVVTGGGIRLSEEEPTDLAELRKMTEQHETSWSEFLRTDFDASAVLVRHRDDGSETHAPISIRLAQALHHGTDHRSQICTALTSLGKEPPLIDVWDYGAQVGTVIELPPTS
jgi:uncharacterized damage-inducible protein DinB